MQFNNPPHEHKKTSVAILCGLVPTYRKGFYDNIFNNDDYEITVYCQDKLRNHNLRSVHNLFPKNIKIVKSLSLKRESLTFHFLPFFKIFSKYDILFVEGNPRNISHFLISTVAKLFNKKIILWTMAHSHNSKSTNEKLRLKWTKKFKFLLVYTEADISYLRERGFTNHTIISMNNGLDQKDIDYHKSSWNAVSLENWKKSMKISGKFCLISSARLDAKNKFDFVVSALSKLVVQLPNILWILIGAGEEKDALMDLVKHYKIDRNILFLGEIYKESDLCPWFLSSELLVHPGSIGLSLMHAFGYGLPILTHNNSKKHGPEFSIFKENFTGFLFNENDLTSFEICLKQAIAQKNKLKEFGNNGYEIVKNHYNTDKMSDSFFSICEMIQKTSLCR